MHFTHDNFLLVLVTHNAARTNTLSAAHPAKNPTNGDIIFPPDNR
jgi:hypothetical protein